jgi:translation initiation factor IF-1
MSRDDIIELEGVIADALPGSMFKVKVDNIDHLLLCYISGRLKQNKIRIIMGDTVKIEVSAYDITRGRIVYRL